MLSEHLKRQLSMGSEAASFASYSYYNILGRMDKGQKVNTAILDLSEAFGTMSHQRTLV